MNKDKRTRRQQQSGFSLMELMIVVVILMIVSSVVVGYIATAQRRYDDQRTRIDMTQESRDFLDQIARDLHQVGFPGQKLNPALSYNTSSLVAAGLVSITPTSLQFEGDVDNTGTVSVVIYQLVQDFPASPAAPNSCPCRLQRGQRAKAPGTAPLAQPLPIFFIDAQGLINSNGGQVIGGQTKTGVANDVYYAAYKAQPVFQAFDSTGTAVALPTDITQLDVNGNPIPQSIKTIRVTMNVLGPNKDNQSGVQPVITMATTARVGSN